VTGTGAVLGGPVPIGPRLLLLVPARSYRAADFLLAAARMGLDLIVASDGALPIGGRPVIHVNPADPDGSIHRILARSGPVAAVVAADTPMLMLAAAVAERLGLPHNPADAVLNAADKARQRQRWAAAGVAQPRFEIVPAAADDVIRQAAEAVGFPCVVKAVSLSASQGILRADDPAAAVTAARRIRQILAAARRPHGEPLVVEEYLPGPELSIDGLLVGGDLTVTAIFDKPGMPDGPTFEETLLVTPSRLPPPVLAAAIATAGQAARALGLTRGPVHAELRIDDRGGQPRPAMLELAARCIGGLCSRALRFPGGKTLEELVLASALGRSVGAGWSGGHCQQVPAGHEPVRPAGVFMLPVPQSGVLRAVEGRDAALAVPGVTGLTITIPIGRHVDPLPGGDRYLGFIFAEGNTPEQAEQALAAARGRLRAVIQ
jgi:ATP-grasp domain/L-amino acid ligase C-terminal domain 2